MQIANLKLQNACPAKLSEAGKMEEGERYFLTSPLTGQPANESSFLLRMYFVTQAF